MGTNQRRWGLVLLVLVMGVVFWLGAGWDERQERQEQAAVQVRIRELMEQRLEILEQGAASAKLLLDYNQATLHDYARAQEKALKAKLALAEGPEGRVEILEEIVKLLKDTEKTAELRVGSQRITNFEFSKIQSRRIKAEIDLLREKMKS